jgi:hypothetical protein
MHRGKKHKARYQPHPGPLPGWSLSILAALALSACTACDLEPQKWLDQHAPAAQAVAGHH